MPTPSYSSAGAAVTGQTPLASQLNQLLSLHAITFMYAASAIYQNTTDAGTSVNLTTGTPAGTNATKWAESFTATTGAGLHTNYVVMTLTGVGTAKDVTCNIMSDSGGVPSGTSLATVLLPADFISTSKTGYVIPMPLTMTNNTKYWIEMEVSGAADSANYVKVEKSTAVSGAASFTGGTWGTQAFGLLYQVFSNSATGALTCIYEDAGSAYTTFYYTAGVLSSVQEYVVGQGSAAGARSSRTITFTSGVITGVA